MPFFTSNTVQSIIAGIAWYADKKEHNNPKKDPLVVFLCYLNRYKNKFCYKESATTVGML